MPSTEPGFPGPEHKDYGVLVNNQQVVLWNNTPTPAKSGSQVMSLNLKLRSVAEWHAPQQGCHPLGNMDRNNFITVRWSRGHMIWECIIFVFHTTCLMIICVIYFSFGCVKPSSCTMSWQLNNRLLQAGTSWLQQDCLNLTAAASCYCIAS